MTPPPGLPAKLEHFIGGVHAGSADGATFGVADPVTNMPYASVAAGGWGVYSCFSPEET